MSGSEGKAAGVATLLIESVPEATTQDSDSSPFQQFLSHIGDWLLTTYSPGVPRWYKVARALGQGFFPPPESFHEELQNFLSQFCKFILEPVDLTQQKETETPYVVFPMFNELQMTYTGHESDPLKFSDINKTSSTYPIAVENYFDELAIQGLMSNPQDGQNSELLTNEEGPSMTALIFTDYFLMLCRSMARELQGEGPDARPDEAMTQNLGGILSRFYLNGVLLPDPSIYQEITEPPTGSAWQVASLYTLTAQQFGIEATSGTISAKLAIHSGVSPVENALTFADGNSVTSVLGVTSPPPQPDPQWSNSRLQEAPRRDYYSATDTRS